MFNKNMEKRQNYDNTPLGEISKALQGKIGNTICSVMSTYIYVYGLVKINSSCF